MGVKHTTLHQWYKEHLSGFNAPETQTELHRYDLPPPRQRQEEEIVHVPILKPENMGSAMAIDEKYLHGKFYTIMTNHQTGKIALLAATHQKAHLDQIIPRFGDKIWEVKTLTRDLSNTYDWLGRTHFFNAIQIADKFHILRHLFDALHDVRIFYRQKLLTAKREKQQRNKDNKSSLATTKCKEETLENGDTHAELLARSIHLLYKHENQWTPQQAKRAAVLFKHYPDIEKAYQLAMKFRNWYATSNVGKCVITQKQKLLDWFKDVARANVPEMLNFAALVKRHEGVICKYFRTGLTNAKAEANNRIIQSLITERINTRNIHFAHFRLKLLLA